MDTRSLQLQKHAEPLIQRQSTTAAPASIAGRLTSLWRPEQSIIQSILGRRELSPRMIDAGVALLLAAATIAWALLAGKDVNFDQLNYHLYAPFNLLGGRLDQDFMAANSPGYQNPLPYVPFLLMVANDWHSWLIAAVLAAFHSTAIVLAYAITKEAIGERPRARLVAFAGAILAFISPVFLLEAGATFADLTTAVFVLAAVLGAIRLKGREAPYATRAIMIGVLLGAAGGLKLSNLVFGPPCALLIIWLQPKLSRALMACLCLGLGAFLGFLVSYGYWGWQLWHEFGNPFFPLFNDLFLSPDFPPVGSLHNRFIPLSLWDALLVPFRMAQLTSWIYMESVAPDLRFAVLLICLPVIAAALLRRGMSRLLRPARSKAWALAAFLASSFALWLMTSGNGRYGIVPSLLCGPVLATVLARTFTRPQIVFGVLVSIITIQVVHLSNGFMRWSSEPWTRTWFDLELPARLTHEPFLYISIGGNSNSYVFPFLAPQSAFMNPIGVVSFDLNGPGGARMQTLMQRYRGRIRVIAMDPAPQPSQASFQEWLHSADTMISRLGYTVVASDCEVILSAGSTYESGQDFDSEHLHKRILRTCLLAPREFALTTERLQITAVADDIAEWCPKLFKPHYTQVERTPGGWFVNYPATDMMLVFKDDDTIIATQTRTSQDIYLGTLSNWQKGDRPSSCEALPTRPRSVYTFE